MLRFVLQQSQLIQWQTAPLPLSRVNLFDLIEFHFLRFLFLFPFFFNSCSQTQAQQQQKLFALGVYLFIYVFLYEFFFIIYDIIFSLRYVCVHVCVLLSLFIFYVLALHFCSAVAMRQWQSNWIEQWKNRSYKHAFVFSKWIEQRTTEHGCVVFYMEIDYKW